MRTMLCPRCWGGTARRGCTYCDGDGRADDVLLSPHFWLSELVRSDRALRLGLRNDPSPDQVRSLTRLCLDLLEPVRDEFGPLAVTSGLRLPRVNGALPGASDTSAHPAGWAADVQPIRSGVTLKAIVDWVIASGLVFDQVIYEGTWVHLGLYRPRGMQQRRQALMAFPAGGGRMRYQAYDPGDRRVAA